MNGWQYGLTYNKEAFELVSVEHCPDAAVTPYGFTSDNETTYGAPLAVGCALGEGDVMTGDAVLERITFKVKDGAVPNAYTIEIVECSAEKGGNSFYYMENADADVVTADYEPTYTAGTVTVEEAEVLPLTVEATTDAADVKPGDTVTVTYTLKNPSKAPVAGYRFHITNSTGLTLNGVTVPATLGGVATVDQTEGGAVVVSLADGATFTDEEIVIATAAFTANADAAGEQTFGAELTDADSVYGPAPAERKYETTATGGSVTLPELEPLTATLTLSKNTVKPGETFTASVKLTNLPATGVGGWDLTLNLPDSLEIVSLENPTIEGGKILGVLNKAEKRIMGTVSGSGDVGVLNLTEDTEIAIITLKASETVSDKVTGQITLTANDVYYCDPDAADGVTEISVDAPEAVSADVTVKPVGEAKFTVSSVTGDTGDTVDVTISITENPGLVSALLKVKYGEGLTLTKVTNGSVFTAENGFTTAHSDAADDLANNPYTLSWEGDLLREDFTGTGDIVTLSFKIPDDAELNEENPTAYAITVETADSELVNTDLAVVPSTAEAGSVTVVCPKIDADGEWATDENGNHYHEDAHGHIFDVGAHEGGTATCLKKAVCEICGKEYGELTAHKGGTATCQKKAECEVCGEEYGELGAHTLEKVPAKDPTKTEDGNLEHYRCTVCGKACSAMPRQPRKRLLTTCGSPRSDTSSAT